MDVTGDKVLTLALRNRILEKKIANAVHLLAPCIPSTFKKKSLKNIFQDKVSLYFVSSYIPNTLSGRLQQVSARLNGA